MPGTTTSLEPVRDPGWAHRHFSMTNNRAGYENRGVGGAGGVPSTPTAESLGKKPTRGNRQTAAPCTGTSNPSGPRSPRPGYAPSRSLCWILFHFNPSTSFPPSSPSLPFFLSPSLPPVQLNFLSVEPFRKSSVCPWNECFAVTAEQRRPGQLRWGARERGPRCTREAGGPPSSAVTEQPVRSLNCWPQAPDPELSEAGA